MADDRVTAWLEWVADVNDEPCRYDHHDLCQAHNLDPRPCPVDEIKRYLALNGDGE